MIRMHKSGGKHHIITNIFTSHNALSQLCITYCYRGNMNECLLGFNGERRDPVSGVNHLGIGYRAYNPALMRFHCPDFMSPFGVGGINTYAFCAGDPVNQSDPSGHHSVGGWLGILAGVVLGSVMTPISGGTSLAVFLSITTTVISTGLAVAQQFEEESDPKAGAALGWAALAVGVFGESAAMPEAGQTLAGLAVQRAEKTMDSQMLEFMPFFSKIKRINNLYGFPMSGEFRNARFLGRNLAEGQISWNIRFEDNVPSGRRLTIMMLGNWEGGMMKGKNEIWENGHWIMQTYRSKDLRDAVLAPGEDFSVYRLAIADSGVNQRSMGTSFAGDFRKRLMVPRPAIGFRGGAVAEGPVAEALEQNYSILSGMEKAGFGYLWGPDSAQYFLTGLSERYGNHEGSITLRGNSLAYPASLRNYQNALNWQ